MSLVRAIKLSYSLLRESLVSPALLLSLALLCLAPALNAQVSYGSLTGNVTDQSKAAVPDATVTDLNTETVVPKQTTANAGSVCLISNLQAGTYKITIAPPSFGTLVVDGVTVRQNAVRRAGATSQLRQVNQTIGVQGAAEGMQTDRADLSHEISSTQLTNLHTTSSTGRNFQRLCPLVPGAAPPAEQNSAGANPSALRRPMSMASLTSATAPVSMARPSPIPGCPPSLTGRSRIPSAHSIS
jgi:Carboxypeptidase regulatory-like domain